MYILLPLILFYLCLLYSICWIWRHNIVYNFHIRIPKVFSMFLTWVYRLVCLILFLCSFIVQPLNSCNEHQTWKCNRCYWCPIDAIREMMTSRHELMVFNKYFIAGHTWRGCQAKCLHLIDAQQENEKHCTVQRFFYGYCYRSACPCKSCEQLHAQIMHNCGFTVLW